MEHGEELKVDPEGNNRKREWLIGWPAVVALVANVALTVVFFLAVRDREKAVLDTELDRRARIHAAAIQSSVDRNVAVLNALEGLYATGTEVDRDAFGAFVNAGGLLGDDVQALEWIPRVPHEERERFEALARGTRQSDFRITERQSQGEMVAANQRSEYFPVLFVEPRRGNEAAVGFDLASNPNRLAALEKARDSGKSVTTDRITLVQETDSQFGVLVFAPIYSSKRPGRTVTHRRSTLRGFALGVFRVGSMMEAALPLHGMELAIYDEDAVEEASLMYQSAPSLDGQSPEFLVKRIRLNLPARTWMAVFTPTPALVAAYGPKRSREILLGGLVYTFVLAVFLGIYFVRLARRTKEGRRLARTLESYNRVLTDEVEQRRLVEEELRSARDTLEERVRERTDNLRRFSNELEARNRELSESNRELDDFAHVASHDLKEPLRGISNYANFLLEDYADRLGEDGKKKLEALPRLAKRLATFIDSLFHFSRVGRLKLANQRTDLDTVLDEVLASLQLSITDQRIEVRRPMSLPEVTCDRVRVTEVFRNLITNAMKYNDKQDKWIEIGSMETSEESDGGTHVENGHRGVVTLYVRDNGIGIREKHHDGIFRIFKRLHGRDQYGGGTGAGLTIVQKIVEKHGGKVWVESTEGEGSTFFFALAHGQETSDQLPDSEKELRHAKTVEVEARTSP